MVKHPEELDFKLGLIIRIGQPASLTEVKDQAPTCDVVYVALFADQTKPLETGHALKVGQTGDTLKHRWEGIRDIFNPGRKLKPNVENDRNRWLKVANGREISVWMKAAEKVDIIYAKGLIEGRFSIRCAEEEFLDRYYRPQIGRRLGRGEEA